MKRASFWSWILSVYQREGLSGALIALQDRDELNVNALLFCCWLARDGRHLSAENAKAIEELSKSWAEEIVAPVRAVRRALKASPVIGEEKRKDIRGRIQKIEIELEEQHCELLETRAAPPHAEPASKPVDFAGIAGENLRAFLAAHGCSESDQGRIALSGEWGAIVSSLGVD